MQTALTMNHEAQSEQKLTAYNAGKMQARKSWLVYILFLIGSQSGENVFFLSFIFFISTITEHIEATPNQSKRS